MLKECHYFVNIASFFIELSINNSDSLVRHLFNSTIEGFTMRALFDFFALLDNIFENCLSLG